MAGENVPDDVSDYLSRIGRKGGHARAKALTPEQRKASAMKAAKAAGKAHTAKARKKRKKQ